MRNPLTYACDPACASDNDIERRAIDSDLRQLEIVDQIYCIKCMDAVVTTPYARASTDERVLLNNIGAIMVYYKVCPTLWPTSHVAPMATTRGANET